MSCQTPAKLSSQQRPAERSPEEVVLLNEKEELKLQALEKAIKDGKTKDVRRQLNIVKADNLSSSQRLRFQLGKIHYYLLTARPNIAYRSLQEVGDNSLQRSSTAFQTEWFLAYAKSLEESGDIKTSIRMLILMDERLSAKQSAENQKQILRMLEKLPPNILLREASLAPDKYIRGWYDFALMRHIDPDYARINPRSLWGQAYPRHPGQRYFAFMNLRQGQLTQISTPFIRTAFMLPFSGPLSDLSESIFAGYISMAEQYGVKVEANKYDTNQQRSIQNLYEDVIIDGNQLIVGPLRKKTVELLYRETPRSEIPILALNSLPLFEARKNFYSYNLDIERSAIFSAHQAYNNQCRVMIILKQDNELGHRIGTVLEKQWSSLGGSVLQSRVITQQESIREIVSDIVEVTNEEVEASKDIYRQYLFLLRSRGLSEKTLNQLLNVIPKEQEIPTILERQNPNLLLTKEEIAKVSDHDYNRNRTITRDSAGRLAPETIKEIDLTDSKEEEIGTQELVDNFFADMEASYERVNADCIFLAMDSIMAVKVRPYLSFYLANDIPVYGTFLLYDRDISADSYRDLQHINYGELPGTLDLLNNGDNSLPFHNVFGLRFYARGRDAFLVSTALARFEEHMRFNSSKAGAKSVQGYYILGEGGLLFMQGSNILNIPRAVYFFRGRPKEVKNRSVFQ